MEMGSGLHRRRQLFLKHFLKDCCSQSDAIVTKSYTRNEFKVHFESGPASKFSDFLRTLFLSDPTMVLLYFTASTCFKNRKH